MPRLKLFVACEKTIFDINGPVSLIGIFQTMNFPVTDAPLPEKAISPTQWAIFSLWETSPEERDHEFTQTIRVFAADGSLWLENTGQWKNSSITDKQVKISVNVGGLPIWSEGLVLISVWLNDEKNEVGSYNFAVRHLRKDENAKAISDPTA
jgi:hypothetical protein